MFSLKSSEYPFTFIGDDDFTLKSYLMKPYLQQNLTTEQRLYKYGHSRSRRRSENLFEILVIKWHIFHTAMLFAPKEAENDILSTLALHYILINSSVRNSYYPSGFSCCRNNAAIDSMYPKEVPTRCHDAFKLGKQVRN